MDAGFDDDEIVPAQGRLAADDQNITDLTILGCPSNAKQPRIWHIAQGEVPDLALLLDVLYVTLHVDVRFGRCCFGFPVFDHFT